MQRTEEFLNIVSGKTARASPQLLSSVPPIVEMASELRNKCAKFDSLVDSSYESFVDYHRLLAKSRGSGRGSGFHDDNERNRFVQEISLFLTTAATEINELKSYVEWSKEDQSSQWELHYREIIAYLLNALSRLNEKTQKMFQERESLAVDPFTLLSSSLEGRTFLRKKEGLSSSSSSSSSSRGSSLATAVAKGTMEGESSVRMATVPKNFAVRYQSEIASVSKMKKYESMGSKHKEALLKEARGLQTKFREDQQEAMKMESTVAGISNMLNRFVSILQLQTEMVDDIHNAAFDATDQVQETDKQLQLTIDRSQSHSRNMVILAVGLGVLLLLLDYLTP